MARIVIVSNRVPIPKSRVPAAGGLTVALRDLLIPSRRCSPPWSRRAESPTPRSISRPRRTAPSMSASPTARCGPCCISGSA